MILFIDNNLRWPLGWEIVYVFLFPNRSLLLRVLMETQRKEKKGKETESVPGQGGARPRPQR